MGLGTYNRALMSNRLPVEVNPFRLIEQRRQLVGRLPLASFPRLTALLADDNGDVAVVLDFFRTTNKLPVIGGSVKGTLALQCQRCLEPVLFELDAQINVVVTTSQTDRRPEELGYEICIIENERLFLQDFIEDEVLLSLPAIPKHDICQPAKALREDIDDTVSNEQPGQKDKENPFAVLKDWKKLE